MKQFGFESRNGRKHIIYSHPANSRLRFGLPYGKKITAGYVSDAIKEIDKLLNSVKLWIVEKEQMYEEEDTQKG